MIFFLLHRCKKRSQKEVCLLAFSRGAALVDVDTILSLKRGIFNFLTQTLLLNSHEAEEQNPGPL